MIPILRRDVLRGLTAAAVYGASGTLTSPLLLSRTDAQVTPDIVRFRPEVEPLASLIERTPRDRCAEMAVEQLRRGVSYRQLMAALFLAGIRNVNPRPPGFALHCVFVIHSAHLISMEAPPDSRLLPIFYALDNFKAAQERDARQPSGDYTMRAIPGPLPALERAAAELRSAMEDWDPERAERAAASLARHRSPADVFEMLWRYGARDYRNIGHKAIFVANACRTLQAIGWQHAEPVLRSLALGLVDFGKQQQVNGYGFDDQCYVGNVQRVKETFSRLNPNWAADEGEQQAARGILESIRGSTPSEACADVVGQVELIRGTWLFLVRAGEDRYDLYMVVGRQILDRVGSYTEAVLAGGDIESGCTVHITDEEYDHGPILLQRRVPILPGDTIGERYRVLRHLGEGGMGAVVEVERVADGAHFALKTLTSAAGARCAGPPSGRRGRRTGAFFVCLAGSVRDVRTAWRKSWWSARGPTQVAPEYEGCATTVVPTRNLPAPALPRRAIRRPLSDRPGRP